MSFDAEIGSGREWAAKSSSEAAAYLCLRKEFLVFMSHHTRRISKIQFLIRALSAKYLFGTKWLIAGSRNFGKVAMQQAGPAPLLTRQLPGEH